MTLKENLKKWILNIIKKGWKCRLTLKNGNKIIGIPIELKSDMELTLRSADILEDEDKIIGTYFIEDIIAIETVENELSDSILH